MEIVLTAVVVTVVLCAFRFQLRVGLAPLAPAPPLPRRPLTRRWRPGRHLGPFLQLDPLDAGHPDPPPTDAAQEGTKMCPDCAERVGAEARICRYCRHEFGDKPQLSAAR